MKKASWWFFGMATLAGADALACHTGTDKLVGVITHKSAPQMHVRRCEVELLLPFQRGFGLESVRYKSKASFQCDAEVLYQKMALGEEVVGDVTWRPGMISRDGSFH